MRISINSRITPMPEAELAEAQLSPELLELRKEMSCHLLRTIKIAGDVQDLKIQDPVLALQVKLFGYVLIRVPGIDSKDDPKVQAVAEEVHSLVPKIAMDRYSFETRVNSMARLVEIAKGYRLVL